MTDPKPTQTMKDLVAALSRVNAAAVEAARQAAPRMAALRAAVLAADKAVMRAAVRAITELERAQRARTTPTGGAVLAQHLMHDSSDPVEHSRWEMHHLARLFERHHAAGRELDKSDLSAVAWQEYRLASVDAEYASAHSETVRAAIASAVELGDGAVVARTIRDLIPAPRACA